MCGAICYNNFRLNCGDHFATYINVESLYTWNQQNVIYQLLLLCPPDSSVHGIS